MPNKILCFNWNSELGVRCARMSELAYYWLSTLGPTMVPWIPNWQLRNLLREREVAKIGIYFAIRIFNWKIKYNTRKGLLISHSPLIDDVAEFQCISMSVYNFNLFIAHLKVAGKRLLLNINKSGSRIGISLGAILKVK
jgi:hypothetical protein